MTETVIIDTDPGTDDALALIMAMNSAEITIHGITTVAGNARISDTVLNTLRIMGQLGYPDVPVFRGASQALKGKYRYGYDYHGPKRLPVEMPKSNTHPQRLNAHEF